jgi:hypothetical protein
VLLDQAHMAQVAPHDVALLRLICLVREGDGYVIRAGGRLVGQSEERRQIDISFGDAAGRGASGELEAAVGRIQHWCDDGTTVALVEAGSSLALRAQDGTEVTLPRSA